MDSSFDVEITETDLHESFVELASSYMNSNGLVAVSMDDGATVILPDGRRLPRTAAWNNVGDAPEFSDLSDIQLIKAFEFARSQIVASLYERYLASAKAENARVRAEREAARRTYMMTPEYRANEDRKFRALVMMLGRLYAGLDSAR